MSDISSEKKLIAWMDGRGNDIAAAIAVRCALRAVPLAAHRMLSDDTASVINTSATLFLPTFRAIAVASVGGVWLSQGLEGDAHLNVSKVIQSAAMAALKAAQDIGTNNISNSLASAPAFAAGYASLALASNSSRSATENCIDSAITIANLYGSDNKFLWAEISSDTSLFDAGKPPADILLQPLWSGSPPADFASGWETLKFTLLKLDQDWQVWTSWYDDHLLALTDHKRRPTIESLELERIQIADETWESGPKHINALIAELEAKYRAVPPPQQPATIEVEIREDGKLHRRASSAPSFNDAAKEMRLRTAWQAHSDLLASLEILAPGHNTPGFLDALSAYRNALGTTFDTLNIIALGVHGTRLENFAAHADDLFLGEPASELLSLASAHGLFILQFEEWREYVINSHEEPPTEIIDAAIEFAHFTKNENDIIDDDVSDPLGQLADIARDAERGTSKLVKSELLRSVGNILSGFYTPLLEAIRTGTLDGVKEASKKVTIALLLGASIYVTALASGMPTEFGWVIPLAAFIKMKLK